MAKRHILDFLLMTYNVGTHLHSELRHWLAKSEHDMDQEMLITVPTEATMQARHLHVEPLIDMARQMIQDGKSQGLPLSCASFQAIGLQPPQGRGKSSIIQRAPNLVPGRTHRLPDGRGAGSG